MYMCVYYNRDKYYFYSYNSLLVDFPKRFYYDFQDIVTESQTFELASFIPMLRERIYTRNAFARQFIVSWVSVLDAVPDIDLIVHLPELLDGLFKMLDDANSEIRRM